MDYKLVLENSSSVAVCTLLSIWRLVFEYQTKTEALNEPWTQDKGCKTLRIKCCTMNLRIQDYCVES